MIISEVKATIKDKIRLMRICLDAYIPQEGKTTLDLVPGLIDLYAEEHYKIKTNYGS
jgi:hypothetical protein